MKKLSVTTDEYSCRTEKYIVHFSVNRRKHQGIRVTDKYIGIYSSVTYAGCGIISTSSLSRIPSLCHLICYIVSSHKNNHFSLDVIGM
jgi:hypothetical protein